MIVEKTNSSFFSNQSETYYLDTETGLKFRRIFAGMSWPEVRPGYIVVVGEELDADESLDEHRCHILGEYENHGPSDLVRRCKEYKGLFKIDSVFSDTSNRPMTDFMRDSGFSLEDAPFADSANVVQYYLALIREMTAATKKILFFGENSKLPGILATLDADRLTGNDLGSGHPPVMALGYVLAAFKTYTYDPNEGMMEIEPEPEEIY